MAQPPVLVPDVGDGTDPVRLRQAIDQLSDIINSLLFGGEITMTGPAQFTISGGGGSSLSVGDGITTVLAVTSIVFTSGATVSDGGGGEADVLITGGGGSSDPITSIYPLFTPTGSSDEFAGASFTGWTAVNSGSHNPTITEANNVLSLLHPGSDAAGELHAYVKAPTIAIGSFVECGLKGFGFQQNFNLCGILFADGTAYGSGKQAACYMNFNQGVVALSSWTGYNTLATVGNHTLQPNFLASDLFFRLVYSAANTFVGYLSPDGVSWLNFTGNFSLTMTPTVAGFFVSTYGGGNPFVFSYRYVKFG